MTVDRKGREILKEVHFDKFREAFIESLMKKISIEGKYGSDIRPIIEETLKEEAFTDFINRLVNIIERETSFKKEICNKTASALVEEDIAGEIKDILKGELEEEKEYRKSKEEEEICLKGNEYKLWRSKAKHFLGKKSTLLNDISKLLKEHRILLYTIFTGIGFLVISAILFGSIYKAIIVGLTLTTIQDSSISAKIANVLGGLGGILIFFTSITILLNYILLTERRNEHIKELARKYLERK